MAMERNSLSLAKLLDKAAVKFSRTGPKQYSTFWSERLGNQEISTADLVTKWSERAPILLDVIGGKASVEDAYEPLLLGNLKIGFPWVNCFRSHFHPDEKIAVERLRHVLLLQIRLSKNITTTVIDLTEPPRFPWRSVVLGSLFFVLLVQLLVWGTYLTAGFIGGQTPLSPNSLWTSIDISAFMILFVLFNAVTALINRKEFAQEIREDAAAIDKTLRRMSTDQESDDSQAEIEKLNARIEQLTMERNALLARKSRN